LSTNKDESTFLRKERREGRRRGKMVNGDRDSEKRKEKKRATKVTENVQ
jgi:hypothetical protein